jgi:purine nucleosidase
MAEMDSRIPVLFDTDIGSDVDDALTLAYLLRHPRCELLGVTTVTGEPQRRAMLADAICRKAGRSDVPIHSGNADPLLIEQMQKTAPQAEVLGKWPHRSDFAANTAVDFLRETIHRRPGEITLLATGPLTNIGLLFRLDPEIPRLLNSLVLMNGLFYTIPVPHWCGGREWNAWGDAHAASIVYGAEGLNVYAVGLDVTTRCTMPAAACRDRLRGGALEIVAEAAEVWFRQYPEVTFHDPLAAAVIFAPEILTFTPGTVTVELASPRLLGATLLDPQSRARNHYVATNVNVEAFFAEYLRVTVPE